MTPPDTRNMVGEFDRPCTPPVALTIAGSDSGGGAGIQADLRTFAAFGVHGCTAIAALTAQNTHEVRGIVATDSGFLRDQIEAVLDDLPVATVKTGMLATAANVRVVAELAAAGRLPHLVVDPVLVSSSGRRLLDAAAERAYVEELFPHALVVTPNFREAMTLLGWSSDRPSQFGPQEDAVTALLDTGAKYVVVKGGDVPGPQVRDILGARESTEKLPRPPLDVDQFWGLTEDGWWQTELSADRVETTNNHGTGCSFASAIAGGLARGRAPRVAVSDAKAFVFLALERAAGWQLGRGHGPIDHLDFAHPFIDALTNRKFDSLIP